MLMFYARSNPEKQAIILPDRIVSFGMIATGIRSVEVATASGRGSKAMRDYGQGGARKHVCVRIAGAEFSDQGLVIMGRARPIM